MVSFWPLLILTIANLQVPSSYGITSEHLKNNVPLSRPLGFILRNNFGKNVIENQANQNYMDLYEYNDMFKNEEGFKQFDENEDLGTNLGRLKDRRRSIRKLSAAGRRRARSKAMRREKLNSQSLISHRQHSLHSSGEQR